MAVSVCEMHEGSYILKISTLSLKTLLLRYTRFQLAPKSIVQGRSDVQSIENIIRNGTLLRLTMHRRRFEISR